MLTEVEIQRLLAEGLRLHQAGQLSEAQQYYHDILKNSINHADALFLLGTSYLQLNDPQQAVDFIERALAINPQSSAIHLNLANALHALGKRGKAVDHFEKAIELDASNAEAHFNLAIALVAQGKVNEAIEHYKKTILINPYHFGAINNLGIFFQQQGNHDQAIVHYQHLLGLQPNNVEANYNIANSFQAKHQYELAATHYCKAIEHNHSHWLACHNLGRCLEKINHIQDAIHAYEKAIQLNPNYPESHYLIGRLFQLQEKFEAAIHHYQTAINHGFKKSSIFFYLGMALAKIAQHQQAVDAYKQALVVEPYNYKIYLNLADSLQLLEKYVEAIEQYKKALLIAPEEEELYNNLGCALGALNRYDEAIACFDKALKNKENYLEAHNNLGCTLMELNKLTDAIKRFDIAISIKSDYHDAAWNKGLAYLCQGNLRDGWPLYEHRPTAINNMHIEYYRKLIHEADQKPTKLLIQSEQGFGDVIQIVRYIELLIEKQVQCWVTVPDILLNLAQRSFPEAHFLPSATEVTDIDERVALMSLPLIMETFSESAIPNKIPYLIPDKAKVKKWNQLLDNQKKKRVGLFWRGKRKSRNDNRSIPLAEIKPLLVNEHIQFIVLQKDITTPEFIELKKYSNITMLDHDLVDFDETAAVMANLDVMISIDSAPVHLAGAVGVKTFALLPFAVDWRWMMERTDSPWYPNTTLFRQNVIGDWGGVISDVKQALTDLTSSK